MCNRNQIVTNGCNGNCCERFTLPFSPNEFIKNKKAIEANDGVFIDDKRQVRNTINDPEIDKIADMLIYLGIANYDPETPYITLFEKEAYLDNLLDEKETIDLWINQNKKPNLRLIIKDNDIVIHHYTCKNFDKQNKICTIYENRPKMCKVFGVISPCKHLNCSISTLNKIEQKLIEAEL